MFGSMQSADSLMSGMPKKRSKTRRGRKPSSKPGAAHFAKLQQAFAKGDHAAVKTHALNLANAAHAYTQGMTLGASSATSATSAPSGGVGMDGMDQDDMGGATWIQGAINHPGALHRELGVPQGQTIPAKKVQAAAHSSNPTEAKRARLAMTLKRMRAK